MGFSRQEYWSGLPRTSPGNLPNPVIKTGLPHYRQIFLPSEPPGKPIGRTIQMWKMVAICDQQGVALLALGCGASFHIKKLEWAFEWSDRSWQVRVTHRCGDNDEVGLDNMWWGTRNLQRPPKCLGPGLLVLNSLCDYFRCSTGYSLRSRHLLSQMLKGWGETETNKSL